MKFLMMVVLLVVLGSGCVESQNVEIVPDSVETSGDINWTVYEARKRISINCVYAEEKINSVHTCASLSTPRISLEFTGHGNLVTVDWRQDFDAGVYTVRIAFDGNIPYAGDLGSAYRHTFEFSDLHASIWPSKTSFIISSSDLEYWINSDFVSIELISPHQILRAEFSTSGLGDIFVQYPEFRARDDKVFDNDNSVTTTAVSVPSK